MATATVSLAISKTCTWAYSPVVWENLQMSSSNKDEPTRHRQSTTLLPKGTHDNNRFHSGGDIKSQLKKAVNNSEKEKIESKREAAPIVADGYSSLVTSKSTKNKDLPSLERILQYAKCFTCERIVKEDHFSEHLLFGPAKCLECHACYNDCQSFQLWSAEQSFGCASCSHNVNFCYCYNPVEYLIENLSKSQNIEKIKISSMINDFIKKLTSLSDKLPWKQGIDACKKYLGNENMRSSILSEGVSIKSNSDVFGIAKRKKVSGIHDSHNDQCTNAINNFEDDSLGVILSQDFNLKELEEVTEFVEIRENTFHKAASNEKKKRKQEKKRKPMQNKDSSDEDLEYLPTPSNGFYYVSTKSIEECPNCNEVLCPSSFTVNVSTFLITTICANCMLAIYITSPEVQILTSDDTNAWSTNSTLDMHKKKRGRPRKHVL